MNHEELLMWQDKVFEHTQSVQKMIDERNALKKDFEEHLSKFFNWNSIEYDKNFDRIELRWEYAHKPIIKKDIGDLGMEWVIKADYDDRAFNVVVIEIYPFGIA